MPFALIESYANSREAAPFFLVVGDEEYASMKNGLTERGFQKIAISDFCSTTDNLPNFDALISKIKSLEIGDKRFVVGVGEYLSLRDFSCVERYLARLKEVRSCGKVVLLLRGVVNEILQIQKDDPRFDRRRLFVASEKKSAVEIKAYLPNIEIPAKNSRVFGGFQALLQTLEDGAQGEVCVKTNVSFGKTLYKIHRVGNSYELVKELVPDFQVPAECGKDEYWSRLASELYENRSDFDSFLASRGLNNSIDTIFKVNKSLFDENYENWLVFIALKYRRDSFSPYLIYALDKALTLGELKNAVVRSICDFSHKDKTYVSFYKERKKLLEWIGVGNFDLADFVSQNRRDPDESIYRLTNLTKIERFEIIRWISDYGSIPELRDVYPELSSYLTPYSIRVGNDSRKYTEYFEEYKKQKVRNKLNPEFLKQVEAYAADRFFNSLPTRDKVVDDLKQKYGETNGKTQLYWLDAFGIEYLGLVSQLSNEYGLDASIKITQASLPTTTEQNQEFYNKWTGSRYPDKDLDEVKHKAKGGFDFTQDIKPTHLARELQIVSTVVKNIADKLKNNDFSRVILTSDHGASRLAVLAGQEEKYDGGTQGEHSGRCCKKVDDSQKYDLPFATENNGWIILANYGRFKGSRKANVEVHGGASLEEVVVPVITFTLRDNTFEITLLENVVSVSFKQSAQICLFSDRILNGSLLIEVYNQKGKNIGTYEATTEDRQHFKATLDSVEHSGKYKLKVYVDDVQYPEELDLSVKSKSLDKMDDDFFD